MEGILILFILFLVVIVVVFVLLMKIINNLSSKLIQIELIKKANNFAEAKSIGAKDIDSMQKLDKAITNKQEKEFVKAAKAKPTLEEQEEAIWKNV